MAMQSLSKLDEEILICSICLDTLKKPKILGCLHRYCKECLANVLANIPDAGTFNCPTCRQKFDVPNGGIEGIKGDFLLEAVLENRKLERDLKDKQKEQICSSCDKHITVVAICPDCGGFVCEACHSSHKVMKALGSHQHIVTLEDIEDGKVTFNVQSMSSTLKAPKCPVHKDMILHINCQTCNKLICPVCAPLHHTTHQLEEIASAAERIKGSVQDLVQKSLMVGKTLGMRIGEFHKVSQAKLDEILGTSVKLKETAEAEEQKVRGAEQESLKRLEEKIKATQQEANEKIKNIRQKEAFLAKELNMMEKFCAQMLKKTDEQLEEKMKKMRNAEVTAQILANDVDNWSVLLAATDLLTNLQVTARGNVIQQVEQAVGSFSDLALVFDGLEFSVLVNKCWKRKWDVELCKIENTELEGAHTKTLCDMTFIKETKQLAIAGLRNIAVEVSVIEDRCKTVTKKYNYLWQDQPPPTYINIAGVAYNFIYSIAKYAPDKGSRLIHKKEDGSCSSPYFTINSGDAVVSCIAQNKNNELIVGICGSSTLYRCNFQAVVLSSIQVKVDDVNPPISLAITKQGEILLCDGENKAVAVDGEGNLIYQFDGRNLADRPLVVSGDRSGFVYVLWMGGNDRGSEKDHGEEEEEEEEKEKKQEKEAADVDKPSSSVKVVRQYSPVGTFISEFIVDDAVTMMTAAVTYDDRNAIVVGTPEGLIQCYYMTSLGTTWSNFIHCLGE